MKHPLWCALLFFNIMRRRRSLLLAYIDPSSGGMLFYVLTFILSALSGAVMIFSRQIRTLVARTKRFFRGGRRR